jgi:hypothetical protein
MTEKVTSGLKWRGWRRVYCGASEAPSNERDGHRYALPTRYRAGPRPCSGTKSPSQNSSLISDLKRTLPQARAVQYLLSSFSLFEITIPSYSDV